MTKSAFLFTNVDVIYNFYYSLQSFAWTHQNDNQSSATLQMK